MHDTNIHITLNGKISELLQEEADASSMTKAAIIKLALFEHFREAIKKE